MPRDSEEDAKKLFPSYVRISYDDFVLGPSLRDSLGRPVLKLSDDERERLVRSLDKSVVRSVTLTMTLERDFATLLCGCTVFIDFGQMRSLCAEAERLYAALEDVYKRRYDSNTKLVLVREGERHGKSLLDTDEARAYFAHFDEFRQKHPDSLRRALALKDYGERQFDGDKSIEYDSAPQNAVVLKTVKSTDTSRAVEEQFKACSTCGVLLSLDAPPGDFGGLLLKCPECCRLTRNMLPAPSHVSADVVSTTYRDDGKLDVLVEYRVAEREIIVRLEDESGSVVGYFSCAHTFQEELKQVEPRSTITRRAFALRGGHVSTDAHSEALTSPSFFLLSIMMPFADPHTKTGKKSEGAS